MPRPREVVTSVRCDHCPATERKRQLAQPFETKETRIAVLRAALCKRGWRCNRDGDCCPSCLNEAVMT
jgi:hypothetical protein